MDHQTEIPDSAFLLFALESIKYILDKNIDEKEQKNQIEELGAHLGERVANFLLNSSPPEQGNIEKISELGLMMSFLGKNVWAFIFGRPIAKLMTNEKDRFIIDCEDIKLHCFLLKENQTLNDDKANAALWFISGIIKGVVSTFSHNCTVTIDVKAPKDANQKLSQYSYNITITILNLNLK